MQQSLHETAAEAARHGDAERLQLLLDEGAYDVNGENDDYLKV